MMTTQNTTEKKYPTHTVYFIKDKSEGPKPEWIKVGVAWKNSDGEGLNLSIDNLGQQIPLTIRKNKPKGE